MLTAKVPTPTETPTPRPTRTATPELTNCDWQSYLDFCIPYLPPDLDCPDFRRTGFQVHQLDPHRFDVDHDWVGCES